jgi:hypothetical protein
VAKRSSSANKRKQFNTQRQARKNKQRIKQVIIWGLVLIGVLAAAGWGIQGYIARQSIGQSAPTVGRDHISAGDAHAPYVTDPPTSGPHASAVSSGFYDTPIADENIVHNLEHGHVAISYDCDQLEDCETVKNNLRRIINRYNSQQVIAVPRQNRDAPIALTAWQRIDLLDGYDEERITAFIEAWRGRAPENVP